MDAKLLLLDVSVTVTVAVVVAQGGARRRAAGGGTWHGFAKDTAPQSRTFRMSLSLSNTSLLSAKDNAAPVFLRFNRTWHDDLKFVKSAPVPLMPLPKVCEI